ncbi:hypothetical protein SAMN05518801_106159 [Novosphingobium sp. CF614]|uniref:hypothetical protein n=1 Tax=Novosphingobium sp. CF614 TaxID=1884364 RepID=UPI0008F2C017|nr:hypothetical protein [Novosphingobium sp. CF614]SFG05435.1 hypothetical protein SAMN05518801_106159 [Novosphingobium sp. CF614]
MKHSTIFRLALAGLLAAPATVALAAQPMMYEESVARHEESRIIQSPIGGIENSKWYDYRINVTETQKELASDLRHSTDIEDQRDAWGEYAHELKDNRQHYVKAMEKKGYRVPRVYFED